MYKTREHHRNLDFHKVRRWAAEKGLSVGKRGVLSHIILDAYLSEWLVLTHMDASDSVAVSVWKTATHELKLDELKAIGYIALVGASKRWFPYCAEKGYSPAAFMFFKPFAQRRIRGAMYDEFRTTDWASRTLRSRSKQLQGAGQADGASIEEMSANTGLSEDIIKSTIQGMNRKPVSLDSSVTYYAYEKSDADVESSVLAQGLMEALVEKFESFTYIQKLVIAFRYHQNLTMKDIAERIGISVASVSQEHSVAIQELKQAMLKEAQEE